MPGKIAFIGGGNMAEAIIRKMIKEDKFFPEQIYVYEILEERKRVLEEQYGVITCDNLEEALLESEFTIFAVRPQDAASVILQVKRYLEPSTIFISICAGITIDKFESWLHPTQKIVRVMPNTLTETGKGYSAICANNHILKDEVILVINIFECIGAVVEINEDMFDTFTAYSCAGPAYFLYMINAMIDAGVRAGFSRANARAMVIENILGTAIKLDQTGQHPLEIVDTMTSPGGVSIEAVYTMNQEGLYGSIMRSVEATVSHSKELV